MREVSYAGGRFTTTDDVAASLLELAVGLAKAGTSERVEVRIVRSGDMHDVAWLMLGLGSSVLSMPCDWGGVEPDFSGQATMTQMHASYPRAANAPPQTLRGAWDQAPAPQWDNLYGL